MSFLQNGSFTGFLKTSFFLFLNSQQSSMVPDFQKLIKDFGAESREVREERGKEEVNISRKTI